MTNRKVSELTNITTLADTDEVYVSRPPGSHSIAWLDLQANIRSALDGTLVPTGSNEDILAHQNGAWTARSLNGAPIGGVSGNGSVYYQNGSLRFIGTSGRGEGDYLGVAAGAMAWLEHPAHILHGAGLPTAAQGQIDDYYLQTTDPPRWYQKTTVSTWALQYTWPASSGGQTAQQVLNLIAGAVPTWARIDEHDVSLADIPVINMSPNVAAAVDAALGNTDWRTGGTATLNIGGLVSATPTLTDRFAFADESDSQAVRQGVLSQMRSLYVPEWGDGVNTHLGRTHIRVGGHVSLTEDTQRIYLGFPDRGITGEIDVGTSPDGKIWSASDLRYAAETWAPGDSFTTAEKNKLAGIEAGAEVNVGVEFTAAAQNKLGGIETGATADQSDSEIVTAVNTNLGNTTWQGGGGSGDDAFDWATVGNTERIPDAKIPIAVTRDDELTTALALSLANIGLTLSGQNLGIVTDGSGAGTQTLPAGGGISSGAITFSEASVDIEFPSAHAAFDTGIAKPDNTVTILVNYGASTDAATAGIDLPWFVIPIEEWDRLTPVDAGDSPTQANARFTRTWRDADITANGGTMARQVWIARGNNGNIFVFTDNTDWDIYPFRARFEIHTPGGGGGGGLDEAEVEALIGEHIITLGPGENFPVATAAHHVEGTMLSQGPHTFYVVEHGAPPADAVWTWADMSDTYLAQWRQVVDGGNPTISNPQIGDWVYHKTNRRWLRWVGSVFAFSAAPPNFDAQQSSEFAAEHAGVTTAGTYIYDTISQMVRVITAYAGSVPDTRAYEWASQSSGGASLSRAALYPFFYDQILAGDFITRSPNIAAGTITYGVNMPLAGLSDIPGYTGNAGLVLGVNAAEDGVEWVAGGGGGGDDAFPWATEGNTAEMPRDKLPGSTLVGVTSSGGEIVFENADGLYLPFTLGGSGTFIGLTDTPAAFGTPGQLTAVNAAGDAIEFVDATAGSDPYAGATSTDVLFASARVLLQEQPSGTLKYITGINLSNALRLEHGEFDNAQNYSRGDVVETGTGDDLVFWIAPVAIPQGRGAPTHADPGDWWNLANHGFWREELSTSETYNFFEGDSYHVGNRVFVVTADVTGVTGNDLLGAAHIIEISDRVASDVTLTGLGIPGDLLGIAIGAVTEPMLAMHNSPGNAQVITWNQADARMEWADGGGGGALDIPGLTEIADLADADVLAIYDLSAGALRKIEAIDLETNIRIHKGTFDPLVDYSQGSVVETGVADTKLFWIAAQDLSAGLPAPTLTDPHNWWLLATPNHFRQELTTTDTHNFLEGDWFRVGERYFIADANVNGVTGNDLLAGHANIVELTGPYLGTATDLATLDLADRILVADQSDSWANKYMTAETFAGIIRPEVFHGTSRIAAGPSAFNFDSGHFTVTGDDDGVDIGLAGGVAPTVTIIADDFMLGAAQTTLGSGTTIAADKEISISVYAKGGNRADAVGYWQGPSSILRATPTNGPVFIPVGANRRVEARVDGTTNYHFQMGVQSGQAGMAGEWYVRVQERGPQGERGPAGTSGIADIDGLTVLSGNLANGDDLAVYDDSAGAVRKVSMTAVGAFSSRISGFITTTATPADADWWYFGDDSNGDAMRRVSGANLKAYVGADSGQVTENTRVVEHILDRLAEFDQRVSDIDQTSVSETQAFVTTVNMKTNASEPTDADRTTGSYSASLTGLTIGPNETGFVIFRIGIDERPNLHEPQLRDSGNDTIIQNLTSLGFATELSETTGHRYFYLPLHFPIEDTGTLRLRRTTRTAHHNWLGTVGVVRKYRYAFDTHFEHTSPDTFADDDLLTIGAEVQNSATIRSIYLSVTIRFGDLPVGGGSTTALQRSGFTTFRIDIRRNATGNLLWDVNTPVQSTPDSYLHVTRIGGEFS